MRRGYSAWAQRRSRISLASMALLAALAASPLLAQTQADPSNPPPASDAPDSEGAALLLADQAPRATERAKDWQLSIEAALVQTRQRYNLGDLPGQRLSLDLQVDTHLSAQWRAVLSDQLDQRWQHQFNAPKATNTLREAYLSWQPQPERALDVGRINARYGVAMGYNPTDYFRSGANRSIISADPASLKKNRQGSVMLRGQTLWNGGSLTALLSPHLADQPSDAPFGLNVGATNPRHRWLIALTQRLSDNLQPQWLLFGEQQQAPQLGFNLTGVLGQASVVYIETSLGRSRSQLAQAVTDLDDSALRTRLATGLTYATDNKLSLTAEYQYNGAALSASAWRALAQPTPVAQAQYLAYRQWLQTQLDLPTRQAVFLYASWQDALLKQLDLNAMLRLNADDHSRLSWLEARYHWPRIDLALQWQHLHGRAGSEYGAATQRRVVQLALRYFY